MKISKNVFISRAEDGTFRVYSPLSRKISIVNESFLQGLKGLTDADIPNLPEESLKAYRDTGIIVDEEKLPAIPEGGYKPVSVTLFPTSDCNLRCVYCYGNAGIEPHTLDIRAARAGIDFVVENALETGAKKITVGYHGCGEPTFAWDVLVESAEYAKTRAHTHNLGIKFSLSTNGVLNETKQDYIIKNFQSIQLSMDGPEDVQNRQRPIHKPSNPGLSGSYGAIMATVERFHKGKIAFSVRPTITNETVDRMEEIAHFFVDKVKPKRIHIEPLFICGRCHSTKLPALDYDKYYENYLRIWNSKEMAGVLSSTTPIGNLEKLSASFCGATGHNFCITPENYITSCFEVGLKSDKRSGIFFFGRYNFETGEIELDESKRRYLASRVITNMPSCDGCFLKWNCGGECLAKVYDEGDLFNPNNYSRCRLNKSIAKKTIERRLKNLTKKG